jgi:hypothetical protein
VNSNTADMFPQERPKAASIHSCPVYFCGPTLRRRRGHGSVQDPGLRSRGRAVVILAQVAARLPSSGEVLRDQSAIRSIKYAASRPNRGIFAPTVRVGPTSSCAPSPSASYPNLIRLFEPPRRLHSRACRFLIRNNRAAGKRRVVSAHGFTHAINPMQSPMHQTRRCVARTRPGSPCQSPAMENGRCRMHGGTSPGAPKGNKNALKHGRYTADAIARRRSISGLIRIARQLSRS